MDFIKSKNPERKKNPFPARILFRLGAISLAVLFAGEIQSTAAHASFTHEVPIQEAVPNFIKAAADAASEVKDEAEFQEVAEWEEGARQRLPEFLTDLIEIAEQLEENGGEEFIVEKYTAFADKWNEVAGSYPGIKELEPALSPIIDQLFAGLPRLPPAYGDNPLSNLYDYYVLMAEIDPWGTGGFWVVSPLERYDRGITISENFQEETVKGYKSTKMLSRKVVTTLNGVVVFLEFVENGKIVNRSVVYRDPSVLHETLEKMILNNEDPEIIAIVEELVHLVDLNIETVYANGILDDCSYSYFHRKELAGSKETCVDATGRVRSFAEMLKFDPFDHVDQVKLSQARTPIYDSVAPVIEADGFPASSSSLLSDNPKEMEGMLSFWFLGVMVPAYVWSFAGIFRMF